MSEFRSASLEVSCPQCGLTIRTTVGHAMDDVTVLCPAGHPVKLVDSGDGLRRVDHALDEFKRDMDQLNRRLKRMGRWR